MNREDISNNEQHVLFLQKKKAEILAKKEREKVEQVKTTSAASPPKVETPPKLKFVNDGSFLERFKLMQQQQQQQSTSRQSNPGSSRDFAIAGGSRDSFGGEKSTSILTSMLSQPIPSRQELKAPASIFLNQEEEVDGYQPSEYDLAKELAQRVAIEGIEAEEEAKRRHQGDLRYQFLSDPSSPVSLYYQSQLREFKRQYNNSRKRRWDDDNDGSGPTQNISQQSSTCTLTSSSSSSLPSSSSSAASSSSAVDPMAEFAKAKALLAAKVASIKGVVPLPVPVMTEEEIKRQKAIEEQRMMNALYRKVIEQQAFMAKQRAQLQKQSDEKPKYEYDSDEDTEGGTWEHKKRRAEMFKTEEWAGGLTEHGRGKHHLSDFLPPEELEKFMENVKAVQEGRQADISDYAKFKIQADNVGFQLLQKAGWEEGSGLGKKGDGIVQPINRGKTSFEQAGVGADKPLDVKKDDDDFELYRKRMMLAYKFRPNPMNNPRRPYY